MSAFAELLNELKPSHVSWAQVASGVGVSQSYMSLLVSGARLPSKDTVEKLSRHMGIEPQPLLIAAGMVPDELLRIMSRHPAEARRALLDLDRHLERATEAPGRASGPARATTEPAQGRLTWKTRLRDALVPLLREKLNPHFNAPWNTSQHQVLVLPRYRMYNAKLFFARFAPAEQAIRFGFWIEKGLEVAEARDPSWKMTPAWDWHRLIGRLRQGELDADDLCLHTEGIEAKASTWGPHDVIWRGGTKTGLLRVEGGQSTRVRFNNIVSTLNTWPAGQWCDFFVSTTVPWEDASEDPHAAAARMMTVFRALYPLLEKTASYNP